MRSTLLSTFVLGLLPSLAVAVIDEDAVNSLPIFSSLDGTLGLITQGNFNVDFTIQQDTESFVVPYITFAPIRLPEFRLTNGNLTTADRDRAAFYGPTTRIFPPPLIPLRFGTGFDRFAAAEFLAVTKTDSSGNDVLRLFALNGPLVVKSLEEGQPIYVKPEANREPTVRLQVEVVLQGP